MDEQKKMQQPKAESGWDRFVAKVKKVRFFRWLFSKGKDITTHTFIVRYRAALIVIALLLVALCCRFAFLQLIDPYHYADAASGQYTYERVLQAKRGTIYASDGTTKLASSGVSQTVFISPSDIRESAKPDDDSDPDLVAEKNQIRMIAEGLAECLTDFNPLTLIEKYNGLDDAYKQRSKYMVVKKNLTEDEEKKVRAFITEKKLERQVAFEEVGKRVYPYGTMAAQLIGFSGTDGSGLTGIEYQYDEYLRGTNGRVVRARDANGNELAYDYEIYAEAENGLNVVTTIDWYIQSVVDKYVQETYEEFHPEGRVSCLVMDIQTGEILASSLYPSYDLNDYTTLSKEYQKKLDAYDGEKKDEYESTLLNEMWNNTIATQTYEPGSTFKVITAAMALETGSITTEERFNCGHSIKIADTTIHCWTRADHGMQNLAESLVNSCNPALAQIGLRVGVQTFKKYFDEFGYTKKTGSDILGEVSSIYYDTTGVEMHDVEIAVYSFGQTFKITMLQHMAALSSVANDGYLVTPHVVKYLTDDNGNIVKSFSTDYVRQVVSESVCDEIMDMLVNSTKNACVNGYNVISKTGTSEKRDTKREDDYISSCVTFAPAEEPQVAVLVTVDTPDTSLGYYGSTVAAPCVGNIMADILPYLGISPSATESFVKTVQIGDYRGESVEEAKAVIEALGLKCIVKGDGTTVNSQTPRGDMIITHNGSVVLYTGDLKAEDSVSVPNLIGSTPDAAMKSLLNKGLNVKLEGVYGGDTSECYVDTQSIASGTKVAPGTVVTVECRYRSTND